MPEVAEQAGRDRDQSMDWCSHCGNGVERSFRFCPWCAAPLRIKLVEWFPAHPLVAGDGKKALRVSRYLTGSSERPAQVRFSVWDDCRAEAVVSLTEDEAARLAAFLTPPSDRTPRAPSLIEHLRGSLRL
jgi:hypothetical protein